MTEQVEDKYAGPHWRSNGAVFVVIKSLREVERVLASMLREERIVDKNLAPFFTKYPNEADSDTDEAMEEFSDICSRLWDIELELSCCVRTAILMSVVELESTINRFCYFNLGEPTTDSIERLSPAEKLEVVYVALSRSSFKGTRPYQAVRALVNWRNAFAHGKCTDMPYHTIKENHLKTPTKYPEPGDEVREMLTLLDEYLLICKHLAKISKHPYTSGYSSEWDEIEELLDKIRTFQFEKGRVVGRRRPKKS